MGPRHALIYGDLTRRLYRNDRLGATELGWPVRTMNSTHLGIITESERTLEAIL